MSDDDMHNFDFGYPPYFGQDGTAAPSAQGPLFVPGYGMMPNPDTTGQAVDGHRGMGHGLNNAMPVPLTIPQGIPQAGGPGWIQPPTGQVLAASPPGVPAQGAPGWAVFSGFPRSSGAPQPLFRQREPLLGPQYGIFPDQFVQGNSTVPALPAWGRLTTDHARSFSDNMAALGYCTPTSAVDKSSGFDSNSENVNGPVAYNPTGGHPGQNLLFLSFAPCSLPRRPSPASRSSSQPFQLQTPAPTVSTMQRNSSQMSHISWNSAPSSATVPYFSPPVSQNLAMPTRPQQTMTTPYIAQPQPRPANTGELLGVGVQARPSQTSVSAFQSTTDGEVVLLSPNYSDKQLKEVSGQNSQFAAPWNLIQLQDPQPHLQAPAWSTAVATYEDPSELTPETRSLLQSAPLTTDSISGDSSSPLSSASGPPSAAGDTTMQKDIAGVPKHMYHTWDATANIHHDGSTKGGRTVKRHHSAEVETSVASTKKATRKKDNAEGVRCLPCALSNSKCSYTAPCDKCSEDKNAACVEPRFSAQNIFFEYLEEKLKERANAITKTGEPFGIVDRLSVSVAFEYLAEHKVGRTEFYRNLATLNANECMAVPFYQTSMMLQIYETLNARAVKDPRCSGFTPKLRDELLVWRAVTSMHALNLIKGVMDKNRREETPNNSSRARNLVILLATVLEQVQAFEMTFLANEIMTDAQKEMQQRLSYNLGFRLYHMCSRAFDKFGAELAKLVVINTDGVTVHETFWDRLNTLWTQANSGDKHGAATGSSLAAGTSMATQASASHNPMLTPIDTNFASPMMASQGIFMAARVPTTLEPGAMQRQRSKASQTGAKGKKPRKPRVRDADDRWDDDRDNKDAEIIMNVRSPIHDNGPGQIFVDLERDLQGMRLDDGGQTAFLIGDLKDNTWNAHIHGAWIDTSQSSDQLGDIYNADGTGNPNVPVADSLGAVDVVGSPVPVGMGEASGDFLTASEPDLTNLDYDAIMSDSFLQAQARDNANPDLAYARMSTSPQGAGSFVGSHGGSSSRYPQLHQSPSRARRGADAVKKFLGIKKP